MKKIYLLFTLMAMFQAHGMQFSKVVGIASADLLSKEGVQVSAMLVGELRMVNQEPPVENLGEQTLVDSAQQKMLKKQQAYERHKVLARERYWKKKASQQKIQQEEYTAVVEQSVPEPVDALLHLLDASRHLYSDQEDEEDDGLKPQSLAQAFSKNVSQKRSREEKKYKEKKNKIVLGAPVVPFVPVTQAVVPPVIPVVQVAVPVAPAPTVPVVGGPTAYQDTLDSMARQIIKTRDWCALASLRQFSCKK